LRSALCTTAGGAALLWSKSWVLLMSREGDLRKVVLGMREASAGLALTPSAKVRPVRERSVEVRLAVLRGCCGGGVLVVVEDLRRKRVEG